MKVLSSKAECALQPNLGNGMSHVYVLDHSKSCSRGDKNRYSAGKKQRVKIYIYIDLHRN